MNKFPHKEPKTELVRRRIIYLMFEAIEEALCFWLLCAWKLTIFKFLEGINLKIK